MIYIIFHYVVSVNKFPFWFFFVKYPSKSLISSGDFRARGRDGGARASSRLWIQGLSAHGMEVLRMEAGEGALREVIYVLLDQFFL